MSSREHWDSIYSSKSPDEVSWYQARATTSLGLIGRAAPSHAATIIDVGGGASTLVDGLLEAGYSRVIVTDIAEAALEHAKKRLGAAAGRVEWRCADVLNDPMPDDSVDVWHDRAVFHFLTSAEDRRRYVGQVARVVRLGGRVIIGTFAEDGPQRCSGLTVVRYSTAALHSEFGAAFELVDSVREEHVTPSGAVQRFQYCVCVNRKAARTAA